MAWVVGRGVRDWIARRLRAAWEYSRGVNKASRGDRRAHAGGTNAGSSLGGAYVGAGGGSCVGVFVGAMFCLVFRMCILGIVFVSAGAVGFVDVGVAVMSPFEAGHGSVSGLYVAMALVGPVPYFQRALMTLVSRRLRVAGGRFSLQRASSWETIQICSAGVYVGMEQCVG